MDGEQNPDKQTPKRTTRAGGRVPWRRDPVVLARLPLVERRHLAGQPNTLIADALSVDESTIREDLKRLSELWLARIQGQQEGMRAQIVAELDDVRRRALHQAEWDEFCERAVLVDDPAMPDEALRRLGLDPALRIHRDDKGAAAFRGAKAQSLNVARQATMDKAKVLGLIVDQLALAKDLQREAEKVAAELGLDTDSKAKLIDFASRKRSG